MDQLRLAAEVASLYLHTHWARGHIALAHGQIERAQSRLMRQWHIDQQASDIESVMTDMWKCVDAM